MGLHLTPTHSLGIVVTFVFHHHRASAFVKLLSTSCLNIYHYGVECLICRASFLVTYLRLLRLDTNRTQHKAGCYIQHEECFQLFQLVTAHLSPYAPHPVPIASPEPVNGTTGRATLTAEYSLWLRHLVTDSDYRPGMNTHIILAVTVKLSLIVPVSIVLVNCDSAVSYTHLTLPTNREV